MPDTAIKLKKAEEDALEQMVKAGLFANKEEAVRAAIVKYASDPGILSPAVMWKKITKHKRRKVTARQLMKDLEASEDETQGFHRYQCLHLRLRVS
jgi:Arc/MetJ-type ribon-helix-helix transcriptional regulator